MRLLKDVEMALNAVAAIGANATNTLQCLTGRQELLLRLLESEYTRLQVWLFPIDHDQRRSMLPNRSDKSTGVSI